MEVFIRDIIDGEQHRPMTLSSHGRRRKVFHCPALRNPLRKELARAEHDRQAAPKSARWAKARVKPLPPC